MPMKAICPYCQKAGVIPDSFLGKDIKCPGCKSVFKVSLPPRADPIVTASSEKPTKPSKVGVIPKSAFQPPKPPEPTAIEEESTIQAECPSCGLIQDLPENAAGCIGTCSCGQKFRIGGGKPDNQKQKTETVTQVKFQTHGGCAAIFIEVIATVFTAGFLGGMGSLVAGRGPVSLASSILFSIFFAIGTFLTMGLLLPVWILFVVVKLIFDIFRSA